MTRFCHEMPGNVERFIRCTLIVHFGRRQYFEMRMGERLISPSEQEFLAAVSEATERRARVVPLGSGYR